jgi:hypothetical protein
MHSTHLYNLFRPIFNKTFLSENGPIWWRHYFSMLTRILITWQSGVYHFRAIFNLSTCFLLFITFTKCLVKYKWLITWRMHWLHLSCFISLLDHNKTTGFIANPLQSHCSFANECCLSFEFPSCIEYNLI